MFIRRAGCAEGISRMGTQLNSPLANLPCCLPNFLNTLSSGYAIFCGEEGGWGKQGAFRNAQLINRLFRLFGSILQWNISRSNRNCQILVLFSLSESSERTSDFHFFQPIFNTSFRLLGPFSVNAICLCKQ